MKFLYFQDFHYQGKNSRNRLGNYSEDLLLKFDEIISIAKKNNCEAILDGGDLFEGDKPSYNVLDDIADKIEKAQIPMFSLFGNHAMSYGHLENSNNTGLMHLQRRSKYLRYLNQFEDLDYIIKPIEYKFGIEEEIKSNGIFIEAEENTHINKQDEWKIAIIHALVTPSKFFDNTSYIECKDIKTNADLVLLAHWHKPFKKVIGNTTFLNIGCCGRLNIDEAKIKPSILLLDTEKKNYEIIELKSAKQPNEIFDLEKYQELKENEKSIDDFIASLNSATWQASDLYSQIEIIGKEQNIDKQVIKYIQDKIKEIKNNV